MSAHLKAILKKLEGQRDIELADLDTYLTKQVAIGEHPDIGVEIEKKIERIDDLESKIETIDKYFSQKKRIIYENLKNNPFGFTKFVGRFIPGLSTALGAANVIDRFNQGEYLRMLMAGGSMLPVLGIPFAAAEMATDAGEALINKEKEKEVIRQRAQNAAKAQESRNQSRDDYTGGGGTVVIGKGGGQTKTVSPRSREAMYSAPTRRSSPPPFRRFNNGGIVGLFRRF